MSLALNALTTPFSVSALTATTGNPSKRFISDAHGRPIKDPHHSLSIVAGYIEHVRVAGLADFRDFLQAITPRQAIMHGIPRGGPHLTPIWQNSTAQPLLWEATSQWSTPGDIFMLTTVERYTGAPGTITRTLDHIAYPPSVRLLMLDYDPDPASPAGIASAPELIARLTGIWPALADVGWLATISTSSAIRDKQTGHWLRPPEGMHLYVLTTGNVRRLREWLTIKLWVAGYGFCKLATPNSQTGVSAVLERALVDLSVFSPERLDFVAGALIDPDAPFFQDRPSPELHPGSVLDLDALPDVTDDERAEYARLVAEARARIAPEQRATVRAHITSATPIMPDAEVEQEITTRLVRAERGELAAGHVLYFHSGITLTAGELAQAQAQALDGRRLADPQEPTYRQGDDAILHWRGGDWRIVSWAHGIKRVYRLTTDWRTCARPWTGTLATIRAEEVPPWR
jgi:hypothetical protein